MSKQLVYTGALQLVPSCSIIDQGWQLSGFHLKPLFVTIFGGEGCRFLDPGVKFVFLWLRRKDVRIDAAGNILGRRPGSDVAQHRPTLLLIVGRGLCGQSGVHAEEVLWKASQAACFSAPSTVEELIDLQSELIQFSESLLRKFPG